MQRVGRGSFGEVYRAFDPTLQRYVALKLLLPRGLDREDDSLACSAARVTHSRPSVAGAVRRLGAEAIVLVMI
jgi:serine/threonine protein kinase